MVGTLQPWGRIIEAERIATRRRSLRRCGAESDLARVIALPGGFHRTLRAVLGRVGGRFGRDKARGAAAWRAELESGPIRRHV